MSSSEQPGAVPPPMRVQVASTNSALTESHNGHELAAFPPALRLREVLGVLRSNVLLIAASVAVCGALTYVILKRERPTYQATALIRLHDLGLQLTQGVGGEIRTSGVKADPILSELVVLRGRAVAGAVVDSLGLRMFDASEQTPARWANNVRVTLGPDERLTLPLTFTENAVILGSGSAALRAPYGAPTGVTGVRFVVPRRPAVERAELMIVPRDVAIDVVLAGVDARAREGTTAIDVTYSSSQRRLAIDVVNRIVAEYKALSEVTERQQDRQRVTFLAQQLTEAEWAFRKAQQELSEFRGRHQVRRSTDRFATEQQTLTQLEMRRREHDSDQRTYRSLIAQMDGEGSSAALRALAADSSIGANPAVSRLFTELTTIEATRDSLVASGKLPAHPMMKQIQERVAAAEGRLRDAVRAQVTVLQGRIGELEQMRAGSVAEMQKLSVAEAEEMRLEQRALSVQQLWEQLREQYQLARMSEAVDAGKVQIIDLATRAIPYSSNKLMKLGLGAATGLFLAIALAFLRERANTSIRRRADIERVLHVPSLAVIPQMRPRRRWRAVTRFLPHGDGAQRARANGTSNGHGPAVSDIVWPLVDVSAADGIQAEAFRSLRARLMLPHGSRERRVLVVTSAEGADGKTTTVANLAVAVAQQGLRVVVVDGDLRRPRIHSLFDAPANPGFVDVLFDDVTVDEAVRLTTIPRVYVMAGGAVRSNAPDMLAGERLTNVFRSLAKRFDLVLVDSPPLNAVPDAAVLAAHADGVILVLRAGRTDRSAASQAVDQLVDVGASIVGAVLNDPDAEAARYPEYASAYSYGYAR